MVWTPPATWTFDQLVTEDDLNEQLRDNLLALEYHTHSGDAGDGDSLPLPSFSAGRMWGTLVPLVPGITSAFDGETVQVGFSGSGVSIGQPAYDATNGWTYVALSAGATGAFVEVSSRRAATVALTPRVRGVLAHVDLSQGIIRFGLATNGALGSDPADGAFLRSTSGGNWHLVTRNAGVETATDTGVAASAAPRQFEIVVVSAALVRAYIAGALVASNTTNIPASNTMLRAGLGFRGTDASTRTCRSLQAMQLTARVKV